MLIALVLPLVAAAAPAADLPWYMRETAMSGEARLTFLEKPWWGRARALKEGESFRLDLNRDGRPDCEVFRRDEHIVQVIDDSGRAAEIQNQASAAYLVSYKGTGLVDRMIVYIDNDGDGKPDEMEMRHYQDGYLRYAWFGENYDGDGIQIFDLKNWHYAGNNGRNKFRGNLQIYLNKYDPKTGTWVPLSECPFAFWDYNRDGHGDVALRVSAAPLASLTGPDADYANNYKYMWAPEATPLAETGNLNVRFSYNIDPQPRREPVDRPHYTFGFTLVGAVPYQYPDMTYTNPRRRPPQTVTRLRWDAGVEMAMNYPARETGFSWDESRSVWRWEGQFWIFERVYLSNTGGPTHRWNMRREYSPKPSRRRQIYYSEADRRYHLFGAAEGWMEAGQLVNKQKDLEFRWYDTDGDGYLNQAQVFEGNGQAPVRVSDFAPRARMVELDREKLIAEYNTRVLPEAIRENRELIAALKRTAASPLGAEYEAEAGRSETAERARYCLDIARELHFLAVRRALETRLEANPYPRAAMHRQYRQEDAGSMEAGYTLHDTLRFWKAVSGMQAFAEHYAQGRFGEAARALEGLR